MNMLKIYQGDNMKLIVFMYSLIMGQVFAKNILMPLPLRDFDPTEAAVTWKILTEAGHTVEFATPEAKEAFADPIMVTGKGLGLFKYSMMADLNGREAYSQMSLSSAYKTPISYNAITAADYDMIVLPGGHAKGIRPYLESKLLQQVVSEFNATDKYIAAICHGVVLASRSKDLETGNSILYGKKVTTLPTWMEILAYNLTRIWMGTYYRTYVDRTTQSEVQESLASKRDFLKGPKNLKRDEPDKLERGFVVVDGNLVTARWPGDAHLFGNKLVELLK